jgi:hypothetical protein
MPAWLILICTMMWFQLTVVLIRLVAVIVPEKYEPEGFERQFRCRQKTSKSKMLNILYVMHQTCP